MQQRSPRSALAVVGRILAIALGVVVGVELLYVIAAAIALRTALLRGLLNSDPNSLLVEYSSASSLIPGRLRVEGLRIRVQDPNVQFELAIEQAHAQISLIDLLKRRFHATQVAAEGVRYRLRNRLQDPKQAELRVKAFPPIAGFSDPPLQSIHVPHKQLGSKPFTIELENVRAHAIELWILEYRYFGSALATGGFRLVPGKRVRVGPASLELQGGKVTTGTFEPVANDARGRLDCDIQDFDVRTVTAWHVFDAVSVKGELKLDVPGLRFTHLYLANTEFAIGGGAGPLNLRVSLERGKFLPGSEFSYRTRAVSLSLPKLRAQGDTAVSLTVKREGAAAIGRLALSAERFDLSGVDAFSEIRPATLAHAETRAWTKQLGVAEKWHLAGATLEVGSLRVPELRLFNAFTKDARKFWFEGGSGIARARADIHESGALISQATLEFVRARATIQRGTAFDVTGRISAALRQPNVAVGRGTISDIEALANPAYIWTPHGATGGGSIRLDHGVVTYREFSPETVRGVVSARFPEAKPVLGALGIELGTLPKIAASVVNLSNLYATADIFHDGRATDLRLHDAHTEGIRSQGRWRKQGDQTRGAFLLDLNIAKLGIELHNSESDVSPFVGREWLPKELARLGLADGGT